jgi:O-antigen/teichoic acid export membrane protein
VATFSHQGSTFISNFLVIKLLDHETYGKFSLVTLTALYAAGILQFALGSTSSKFVARYVHDANRLRSAVWIFSVFTLASGLLGLAILAASSGLLARSVFAEPSLTWPLAIVSLAVPGLIGVVFLGGLLQGLHGFRSLAISSLLSGALFVAIVVAGAWLDDLTGAVLGFAAGAAIRCLVMGTAGVWALRGTIIKQGFAWREVLSEVAHELRSFQVPAGLAGFVTLPTLWLIPTILARSTQNFSEVALYSVIFMLKTLVVLPASVISIALQPSAEKACATDQIDTAMKIFRTASLAAFACAGILALLCAVFARDVLSVFGKSFTTASSELRLMMLAAVAEAVAISLAMRNQASNRMWESIFVTLVPRDVIMLAIVIAFAATWGLQAAIAAHVAGAIANLLGTYWLSLKSVATLKLSPPDINP